MVRFARNATIFVSTALLLYLGLYGVFCELHYWARTKNDPSAVYVLGDSRTVHGLDIEQLSTSLERPVHSHATHGASVYVLYAMAQLIPDGATVLVNPTLGMIARRRDRVDYRSRLSIQGVMLFAELGYDWWFFNRILADNRYPFAAPHTRVNRDPFPITDGPDLVKRERFERMYLAKSALPHYEKNKVVFEKVMGILLEKGCDVKVVVFPVTPQLDELHDKSMYGELWEELPFLERESRIRLFRDVELPAEPGKNIWYDMDHLNVRGREMMTNWVLENVFKNRVAASPR